mgnify:CR=1 FL=1
MDSYMAELGKNADLAPDSSLVVRRQFSDAGVIGWGHRDL